MKRQVRDTNAGKSIGAWLVLKDGKEKACIQAYFADSGGVWVDVYVDFALTFQGRATGYGYDKLTAALKGCKIDNIILQDHPGEDFGNGCIKAGLDQIVQHPGYKVYQAI